MCLRTCAFGNTLPSLGCFRVKQCSKSTFYIVFRYSLYAFRSKLCQGVLFVRSSSPCSRMKTAKIVCCPGNHPRIRMRCRKIAFRPCLLSRNEVGYSINSFCPVVFAIDDACLPVSVGLAYSTHAI